MANTTGYFVLILKCTEATLASTPAVAPTSSTVVTPASEETNTYEKIHMFQLVTNDVSFNALKNIPSKLSITPTPENKNDKNHAIVLIKLSSGTINVTNDYQEIKYFDQYDIDKFIKQMKTDIDGTGSATPSKVTEMNCYQSKYEMKNINAADNTYKNLTINPITTPSGPTSNNILINNGGKIVVTSSKNDDLIILHYVSKMFGFEDIIGQLDKDLTATVRGGASLDDFEEEFTDTQAQNQIQEGGMKRKTKQNTRKKK